MPVVVPLTAVPATPPSGVAAASVATLDPGDGVDVAIRSVNNPVRVRPYFYLPVADAWFPLGGDSVSAAAQPGTSAAANTTAHHMYPWGERGQVWACLVLEVGNVADCPFAEIASVWAGRRR